MANTPGAEWQADVKVAAADPQTVDPAMLPVYTALPTSPDGTPAPSAVGPNDSASNVGLPTCVDGLNIFKLFWTGLAAIVLPPAIVAAAAIASAAVMLYGCGKMLEGIGRGLAYAPEHLYKACIGKQVKKVAVAWRTRRERATEGEDVEAGAIAI
ncbi:hypothetical protein L227DRAFT_599616 [Lentinus tigrinus ALCF2SS1-6]|uniref:Uncharacterized protein n=1 Tax=Lentinus tigrinus ALCF2SS1-6 TaxID=1328759 RepID=A0A5C2SGU1_9APHY|nr:hypothetical protein L227DRAFT_599616 [Lentinus tigrinus ALCF2SS1-6]